MINCVVWLDYHILTRRLSVENYKIEIKETLCKIVEVEASSSEQVEKWLMNSGIRASIFSTLTTSKPFHLKRKLCRKIKIMKDRKD